MSLNLLFVGRGGAGNFMTNEAVQDADKKAANEVCSLCALHYLV